MGKIANKMNQKQREEQLASRHFCVTSEADALFSQIEQHIVEMNAAKDAAQAEAKGFQRWLEKKVKIESNVYHFFTKREGSNQLQISFGQSVESVLALKQTSTFGSFWLAIIEYEEAAGSDAHRYCIRLDRCVINEEGRIENDGAYLILRQHLDGLLGSNLAAAPATT